MKDKSKRIISKIFGNPRDPKDKQIFHQLSLVAFLAWVGLGSDGLSSSCYGPEEAFKVLGEHAYLGIFVALASAVTIFIISTSYSQIIELFPTGGGGYLVASKLLSPKLGMVSGSALIIDYVLTIAISIASGTAAIFSFLPASYQPYRLEFALFGVAILLMLNLRGVREAVVPLVPIFIGFLLLHIFAIGYAVIHHLFEAEQLYSKAVNELSATSDKLGIMGMIFLILKSYSMGAGTYTGIEAVSNGLPILRDPKVKTAHKTMRYMAISLALTVLGLMISYLLLDVHPSQNKTLNAILFQNISADWGVTTGSIFVFAILLSEAFLLFIAAQTGFLDGPRVLSNMAIDRWMPTRFANLSNRLVTQNGILLMGGAAFLMVLLSKGSITFLVVLYSINVFVTFSLSQMGMVNHWWQNRKTAKGWKKKIAINFIGLSLTIFILITLVIIKFYEGGWITVLITGLVVALCLKIKKHYNNTLVLLKRLDEITDSFEASIYNTTPGEAGQAEEPKPDYNAKTAVVLVNGFNGLGAHTLLSIFKLFPRVFKNFVFIQVGSVDAGSFKGAAEVENLQKHIESQSQKYVDYMKASGFYAEAYNSLGTDLVQEITASAIKISEKYPSTVFFGGQLVFPKETFATRILHNFLIFEVQREFYHHGLHFVIMPIRV